MTAPKPSPIAALEQRLERSATSPRGVFIMTRDEAKVMLEEIRRLRAHQDHQLEIEPMQIMDVPPGPSAPIGKVVLYVKATINGRPKAAHMTVDEYVWTMRPAGLHDRLKDDLRHRFVEGIVAELDPSVTVEYGPSYGHGQRLMQFASPWDVPT